MHTCLRRPDPRWPTCPCGPAGAGWEVRIPGPPSRRALGSRHKVHGLVGPGALSSSPNASPPPAPLGLRPCTAAKAGGMPSTRMAGSRGVQTQGRAYPQPPALSGRSGSTWGFGEPTPPPLQVEGGSHKAPHPTLLPLYTAQAASGPGAPGLPTPGSTAGQNKACSRNPGHTPRLGVGEARAQRGLARGSEGQLAERVCRRGQPTSHLPTGHPLLWDRSLNPFSLSSVCVHPAVLLRRYCPGLPLPGPEEDKGSWC